MKGEKRIRKTFNALIENGYKLAIWCGECDVDEDPLANDPSNNVSAVINDIGTFDWEYVGCFINDELVAWLRFDFEEEIEYMLADYTIILENILEPIWP